MGPAKSTWTLDHGCSGYVQCESIIRGGFCCASMQGTQLLIVFSMSESMLGQYIMLQAMAFIRLMPECPECNCLRTALLSFVGITTQSANIRHSSMMGRKSLCRWNCCSSPVRSDSHEHLRNWITFWSFWSCYVSFLISTLVTGTTLTQSISVYWISSLMLIAAMTVS